MTIRTLSAVLLLLCAAACGEPTAATSAPATPVYDGGHTIGSGNRSGESTTGTTTSSGHGFGSGNDETAGSTTETAASDSSAAGRGGHTIGSGN